MRLPARRLPGVLGVLVMAFAPFEPRPLLAAAELFRGMAIQLAYRWPTHQVMGAEDGRAALLWSVPSGRPTRRGRRVLGVIVAVLVGIALFTASNTLLLLPLGLVLRAAGVSPDDVADVRIFVIGFRLSLTGWRAVTAYRHDAAILARFPAPGGRRLRIDYLAAAPSRSGHGGRLLQEFLRYADDLDAEVVLDSQSRNLPFYRRHGFHLVEGVEVGAQRLMVRRRRTDRRRAVSRTRGPGRAATPPVPAQRSATPLNSMSRSRR